MKQPNIITLLTDFGHEGGYVSVLKGVILNINLLVQIVDISHHVPPQNIHEAAYSLLVNYPFFPKGTIHVVVVDPGVGSRRKLLCAKTSSGIFIAPDNGLLAPVLEQEKTVIVREVTNERFFLPKVSNTFHGRDKMAPCAAFLSRGSGFNLVGPRVKSWKKINLGRCLIQKKSIKGTIIHIDRFGNLVTNVKEENLSHLGDLLSLSVGVCGKKISGLVHFYSEVSRGELLSLIGSTGYVEISRNLGSAAEKLKAKIGDVVEIKGESSEF